LGPPAIINGLDPRTPSATVPPPLDPLHVALTPHLPDEICKVLANGMHPEPTPFVGKKAPQWPRGLRWLLDGAA
jgi:hypothetical protein